MSWMWMRQLEGACGRQAAKAWKGRDVAIPLQLLTIHLQIKVESEGDLLCGIEKTKAAKCGAEAALLRSEGDHAMREKCFRYGRQREDDVRQG